MRTLVTPNRSSLRRRLLFLLAVVWLSASSVFAASLAEYRQMLDHIQDDLQWLSAKEEDETDADYEDRFVRTIEAMRKELPKTETVELDEETWNVDNSSFHAALDELQSAPPEQRNERLIKIGESLRAISDRVHDLENAKKVSYDKNAANGKLKDILARPEYATAPQGQNALSRALRDFIRWIQDLFPKPAEVQPGSGSSITSVLQFVIVGVALLLIVYVLRLLLVRFRRPGAKKIRRKREARIVLGEQLEPEDTASDLLSEAEALARRGDLRGAIRKGYIALLVELGDRKLISLAQYKTNRDYLRSVSSHPQLHSRMQNLTDSFERHWYGFAQVTPNDWQDFRSGYREALQTGN